MSKRHAGLFVAMSLLWACADETVQTTGVAAPELKSGDVCLLTDGTEQCGVDNGAVSRLRCQAGKWQRIETCGAGHY